MFGVRYSRFFAYLHYVFYTCGQILTLAPMFWLGYSGMPRRVLDYPSTLAGWHGLATSGHLLTVLSFVFFVAMLFDSFYEGRALVSRTQGVSRLSTRLAFYAYESRKVRLHQVRALVLTRNSAQAGRLSLKLTALGEYETTAVTHVFTLPR